MWNNYEKVKNEWNESGIENDKRKQRSENWMKHNWNRWKKVNVDVNDERRSERSNESGNYDDYRDQWRKERESDTEGKYQKL